jgi:perosamine synthetase
MNQLAAAVALAQTERQDDFIKLRKNSAESYLDALNGSSLLTPQKMVKGNVGTYYTFSAKFRSVPNGPTWEEFRMQYKANGGDGIYAASKLLYQEPIFRDLKIGKGVAPEAEKLQNTLMNFTTNQKNSREREIQHEAMTKTRKYFGDI